ncbi:MAG: ABC transporter substrate-binding protein, partial [bacterium]
PGYEAHNPNVTKYAYDSARARQLLTEAGFAPGPDGILRDRGGKRLEMTIMSTAGNAIREQVQQILREHLKAVGVDLRIDNRPAGVLFGQVTRRRTFPHMAMYNWNFNPLTLGPPLRHSDHIPAVANNREGQNVPGCRHAENDRLLDQIAEELDVTKRIQLLRRQQEIWADEVPSIPLFHGLSLTTSKKTLRNVRPGVIGGILFRSEGWEWAQ